MTTKEEEFQKHLLDIFKVEAAEHLKAISSGLLELEKARTEEQPGIVEAIYRESHSLKGAARSVDSTGIVAICQAMEDVFLSLKRNEVVASPQALDLLHRAVDSAGSLVSREGSSAGERTETRELLKQLEGVAKGGIETEKQVSAESVPEQEERTGKIEEQPAGPERPAAGETGRHKEEVPTVSRPAPPPAAAIAETVRISTARLKSLLLKSEELLSVKLATGQLAEELKGIQKSISVWKKEKTKPGDTDSGIGPFVGSLESRLSALVKTAEYDYRSAGTMVDNLLEEMKRTLMLPLSSLLEIFPKFVRDLSRNSGKKVEFSAEGGEVEIDRRILEEIKDPLIHLVRNCVDHGIEAPEERRNKKKTDYGSIRIRAATRDSKV